MTVCFVTKELFTAQQRQYGSVRYAISIETLHDMILWQDTCARYTEFLIFLENSVQVFN